MEKDIDRCLKTCFGYGVITEHGYFVTYDPFSGILVENANAFPVDLGGSSIVHLELSDNIEKETL